MEIRLNQYPQLQSDWNIEDTILLCSRKEASTSVIPLDPISVQLYVNAGVEVIFSTYHSSHLFQHVKDIELIIYDEAHHTVGFKDKTFSISLIDSKVKSKHRVFMTATPKEFILPGENCMSDENVYGKVAYELSFKEAVDMGLLCDYKVIVALGEKKLKHTDEVLVH